MATLIVEISGPSFTQNANQAARKLIPHSVDELRVTLGSVSPDSPQVKSAVTSLQAYLKRDAAVIFISSAPGQVKPAAAGPGFGMMPPNTSLQTFLIDQATAASVLPRIEADVQKQQAERWQSAQDAQTKIFEIQQDVTTNRARAQDKVYKNWDAYIRG